ncbi:MAG: amidohydrolase family protein [Desulfobacter sp.]|nr:MAG: amidohydrolase family protein [Desulfobacter sp.]
MIENGYIETENGKIKSVSRVKPRGTVTDLGPGVILPALVNAHTHLELSALHGAVPFDRGFAVWVQELLARREAIGTERLREAAAAEAERLPIMGTGVVGEISTLGITRDILRNLGLSGVWFQEILGGMDISDGLEKSPDLSYSMAGHAPHTTGPDRLCRLKKITQASGLVFSIHLAESRTESEFLDTGAGAWADFLAARGIDTGDWPLGNTTPVWYLNRLGILGPGTLAVHLLRADARDMEILARTGTRVCICPRSNENLHRRLPDIGLMLEKGIEPALGTDSLASCDSLNLFDEMAFIRRKYPDLRPEILFSMATVYGARALGVGQNWGELSPGKPACFLYANLSVSGQNQIFERLTANEI